MIQPLEIYGYDNMPSQNFFRVLELLPGQEGARVSCLLHVVDWSNPLEYEAISYAWGDANDTESILCQGRELKVTRSLYSGLEHFRLQDQSRILWADAICINQSDITERSGQVSQMLRIYRTAKAVLVWLGPDSQDHYAQFAIHSIRTISDFLCQKVGISVSDLSAIGDVYQEVVFKNHESLPLPNECEFSTEAMWKALIWFYSHSYFTRVWAVQEINANKARSLHCGRATIEWDRVALVAGYIIMETAFSKGFGFSNAKCWWAAVMTTDRIRQPKNWLFMLYLASNFSSTDPRDHIYGLRGLMNFSDGAGLLDPNYDKSIVDVYRDSVEAGFVHFQNTDVLLYRTSNEIPSWISHTPSWIPCWDLPMLFRNPFRFGKALPWKPAGETIPIWSINKTMNVLSLSGFVVDYIKHAEPYHESIFGNATIKSDKGRDELKQVWNRILATMEKSQSQTPLSVSLLTAAAISFSFGLDEKGDPADERHLLSNFAAYLKLALDEEAYNKYIPPEVSEESKQADGLEFGKPVWDFTYPESSFFLTKNGLVGCCVSTIGAGDMVYVPLGSKYPFVLRPDGDCFLLSGYAYVHGIMHGERRGSKEQVVRIH